jgi:hypothetical protein
MDLEGWHPREIPETFFRGATLQQQQFLQAIYQDWRVPLNASGDRGFH